MSIPWGHGMDLSAPVGHPAAELLAENFDPAVLIDAGSGRFLAANGAARELLGFSSEELADMTPADIHPHEIARLEGFMANVRREGRWSSDELSCRTRDGRTVPALLRARMMGREDGGDAVLIVIRDQRERQLAELGSAVRQLTHDLKNTLATAQLMCDRLAAHEDDRVRLSSESMARALERALDICRQTVQAGRVGLPAPDRERFLLADVVEELAATAVGPDGSAAALEGVASDDVLLDADFDQTYRILLNLVRNAFDAGARSVRISGRNDGESAVIEVADDGPGLPGSVAGRIGQDQLSGREGGSGLGLRICHELCRNHGGRLEVARTGPAGTCFRVTLPFSG
ncbi:ATP-binding protein [Rhodovulum sp. 12E13]|uniref:ATP-binding protein n=1 Tax=Rhodovulum sp. 12E13 TaxID=2203891 RepID=UPI00131445CC|nr:PAS domain-containing sensor histidine kinase [Rhodovulum sp. 12E13]